MENSSKTETGQNDSERQKQSWVRLIVQDFMVFERTCSTVTAGLVQLLWILGGFHALVSYWLLTEAIFSQQVKQAVLLFTQASAIRRFLQILVYFVGLTMLGCLFGAKISNKNHIWYSTLKRIISLYSLISRVLLFTTAYLLLVDFQGNIAGMVIAIIVTMFETLFIENYCLRKEENYQSSPGLRILFKMGLLLQLTTSSLLVRMEQSTVLCALTAVFGGFWLIWHQMGGHRLFIHKTPRRVTRYFCGVQISFGLNCLVALSPRLPPTTINPVQMGVTIVLVSFYLYLFEKKKRQTLPSSQKCLDGTRQVKQLDLNLHVLLEEADQSQDTGNLIIGVLCREMNSCQDERCWVKYAQVYDPVTKMNFSTKEIAREKDIMARFYIRCLYHRALEGGRNKQLLLDFAEFGISAMGDFSSHCIALGEAETAGLGFLERIRAHKLRLILREQSEAFNRLIHGGRLEFDEILVAQETYATVLRNIGRYCRGSIGAWTEALQSEVDLSVLRGKLSDNFALLPQINEGWNSISKFFGAQRHWKMVYLHFALFLKNERIKARDIINSDQSHQTISAYESDMTPLNGSLRLSSDIAEHVYFDKRSTLIMCRLQEGQLKFIKASKTFESLTGFTLQEVTGSPLEMILPQKLKKTHGQLVNKWINEGLTTYQDSFYVKRTHFLTKNSEQISALVNYKLYVDLSSPSDLLRFVCLLTSSQKEEELLTSNIGRIDLLKRKNPRTTLFQPQKTEVVTKTLTLDPTCNIFMKQEHLQPASKIEEIQRIKIVMRLITILLILFLVFMALNYQNNVGNIAKHAESLNTVINLYSLPMSIGRLYYNCFVIPPFAKAYTFPIIFEETANFKKYVDSPLTPQIIFDPEINVPAELSPDKVTTINQGITYSSSDVFYLIVSAITTLSGNPSKMSPHDFSLLNSYLQPAYGTTLNSTKNQLHVALQLNISSIKKVQHICIIALSLILLAVSVYISYEIYTYFSKMKEVIDIIVQFNNKEIQNIIGYWQNVSMHFERITERSQMEVEESSMDMTEQVKEEVTGQNKASLNQKHKDLVVSDKERTKKYKVCILMIVLIIGFVPTILSIQIVNLIRISSINSFQEAGFNFIKYFPTTSVAGYALANRYYSQYYPTKQQFNYQKFQETLSALDLIITYDYLKDIESDSMFFQKEQNYLFGNPCTFNPDVLSETGSSISSCVEAGERTLSNGIVAYLRYIHPILSQYLQGSIQITDMQLKDMSTGLKLVGFYLSDAIEAWFAQLSSKVAAFYQCNLLLSVLVSLLLLILHIAIFQWIVLPNLNEDYRFMKNIFSAWVPEYILTTEKVIKHRFYKSGILEIN